MDEKVAHAPLKCNETAVFPLEFPAMFSILENLVRFSIPNVCIRHVQQEAADFTNTLNMASMHSRRQLPRPERKTYETEYVRSLFDGIAGRYDLLNHVLSSGIDILWRRRAVGLLASSQPADILDIATGTGDLAFEALRRLRARSIVGIDVSNAMLKRARVKSERRRVTSRITFEWGAAEKLRFPANTFDAAMVAFGVRNFADLDKGLQEMIRVLKPGGAAVILEFSRPKTRVVKDMYRYYAARILPGIGGMISKNREAYSYLPDTIEEFPDGEDFARILRKAGFQNVQIFPQTFGIATIYHGIKEQA